MAGRHNETVAIAWQHAGLRAPHQNAVTLAHMFAQAKQT